MREVNSNKLTKLLNEVVYPCCIGVYIFSERPALEGVHAFLCAKEILEMLENGALIMTREKHSRFDNHKEGIEIVKSWAESVNLKVEKEVDISVGVADVLVYADDIGIFEIGTIRPTKMLLLLKYIVKIQRPFTVHFWPYGSSDAIVFKNWKFHQ